MKYNMWMYVNGQWVNLGGVGDSDLEEIRQYIDTGLATKADSDEIAAVQSAIDELTPTVEDNTQKISELNARMPELDELKTKNIELDVKDAQHDGAIESLTTRVNTNETSINDLTTRAELHHQEIDNAKAAIAENTTKIGTNTTAITNVDARVTVNEQAISNLQTQVSTNQEQIESNVTDIQNIVSTLAARESFIGNFLSVENLKKQPGFKGAYAHCYETNTKWVWNITEEEWEDSDYAIEDQIIDKSTITPFMDGEASAGVSNTYAAGDHIHPTDTSRAAVSDLNAHTQDTANPHMVTKAQVGLDQVDNTSDLDKPLSTAATTALNGKVDKEVGKVLSSNDFSNEEKTKLANLENYTLPAATDVSLGGIKIDGTDFAIGPDGTLLFTGSGVGASAYEVAQANGYTGTEAEWLESLKGANGTSFTILGSYESESALRAAHPTGNTGDSYLIEGFLWVWSNNDWINAGYIQGPQGLQGIQGPEGPAGPQGPQGEKGDTGTSIKILGSYTSAEALIGEQLTGNLGDSYLVNGDLYVWNGTTWENVGNISGPQGIQGEKGEKGERGETGASITVLGSYNTAAELTAAHPTGSVGQSYLVNGALYVWNGSAWENVGYIQGPEGPTGPQGEKGEKGDTGTIKIEQITDNDGNTVGARLTSNTTGTSAIVSNGENGRDGLDGISPTATIEETDTGAIITIEDKNGTTTAELFNGVNGSRGYKGENGVGIASIAKTATTGDIDTYTITYTDNSTWDYSIRNGATIDKLSQLENDSGYLDEDAISLVDNLLNYYKKEAVYTKEEVNEIMSNLSVGLKTQVVEVLPAKADADTATMYLIETSEGSHIYNQYMLIGGNWANLGTTSIDLSDYYTTSQIDTKLSLYASIQFIYTLLADYAKTSTISTVGKTGSYNDLTDKPTIPSVEGLASTTYVDQKVATAVDTTALHEGDVATVAKTGKYSDLIDKPTIPSVQGLASTTYVDNKVANIDISSQLANYRKKTDVISYNDLANKPSEYTLPVASATVLGGIKVGTGLQISNGVLSIPTPTEETFVRPAEGAAMLHPFPSKANKDKTTTEYICNLLNVGDTLGMREWRWADGYDFNFAGKTLNNNHTTIQCIRKMHLPYDPKNRPLWNWGVYIVYTFGTNSADFYVVDGYKCWIVSIDINGQTTKEEYRFNWRQLW